MSAEVVGTNFQEGRVWGDVRFGSEAGLASERDSAIRRHPTRLHIADPRLPSRPSGTFCWSWFDGSQRRRAAATIGVDSLIDPS
jgi:hypothetical protein